MKIICIGRNYADHAKEMNAAVPTEPVFFMKPDTALLKDGNDFYFPNFTKDLHYECELIFRIDKMGKHIQEKYAPKYYSQVSLGIDFTARDLQKKCKENGLPWEIAKSWEHSAPISNQWINVSDLDLESLEFKLLVNGQVAQHGKTKDMIFNINQLVSYVSGFMTLKTGDLIYTGTPAGVGSVKIGDQLEGFIGEIKMFEFTIK